MKIVKSFAANLVEMVVRGLAKCPKSNHRPHRLEDSVLEFSGFFLSFDQQSSVQS